MVVRTLILKRPSVARSAPEPQRAGVAQRTITPVTPVTSPPAGSSIVNDNAIMFRRPTILYNTIPTRVLTVLSAAAFRQGEFDWERMSSIDDDDELRQMIERGSCDEPIFARYGGELAILPTDGSKYIIYLSSLPGQGKDFLT